jgi:hypothetical protein
MARRMRCRVGGSIRRRSLRARSSTTTYQCGSVTDRRRTRRSHSQGERARCPVGGRREPRRPRGAPPRSRARRRAVRDRASRPPGCRRTPRVYEAPSALLIAHRLNCVVWGNYRDPAGDTRPRLSQMGKAILAATKSDVSAITAGCLRRILERRSGADPGENANLCIPSESAWVVVRLRSDAGPTLLGLLQRR